MPYGFLRIGLIALLLVPSAAACGQSGQKAASQDDSKPVRVGAEVLLDRHLDELKGRRVGLVMNPTARVNGVHMLDTLLNLNVNIRALYAPEHGFRGNRGAGETIANGVDSATGLPVYSLYGKTRKPTADMLEPVDLLLFDMQDVGARFYTYYATLGLVLEAAAANNVEVWVLDRPNPAGGDYVAGWIREPEFKSFVGPYPIPIVHGMTMGELARMMIGEGWLDTDRQPRLRVIKAEGWKRSMKWPDTGLEWIPPSPNLPEWENAFVYLGTCFFEGSTFSEGRGTDNPFLKLGAPGLEMADSTLIRLSNHFNFSLKSCQFTPRSIPGKALHPDYEDQNVNGVCIQMPSEDTARLDPVAFGVALLGRMLRAAGDKVHTTDYLYKLAGSREIDSLLKTSDLQSISKSWQGDVKRFRKQRKPYLLYE